MATEAARLKAKNRLVRKRKTDLTLTGLLMEGLIREQSGFTSTSERINLLLLTRHLTYSGEISIAAVALEARI
jgi:hypothetical protein